MKPRNWVVVMGVLTAAYALEVAKATDVEDVTFVYGVYGGWSFYSGSSAYGGTYAGEWTARVDGRPAVGYFAGHPWAQDISVGAVTNLASIAEGYKAAWLIDRFALGLGNDGTPAEWAGGPVGDAEKRAALALAVFEVGLSPTNDTLDLSAGHFSLFFTPAVLVSLGQAYLDALTNATLDEADLEARYDVVTQPTGNWGDSRWVAVIEQPVLSEIEIAPSNTTLHVGERLHFTAIGADQFGYPMAFTSIWSASGGPIDGAGDYMPTNAGVFEVIAEAAGSSVRGTSVVAAAAIPITGITGGPPFTVTFPSYTTTLYRLQHRSSVMTGDWTSLPGDVRGVGGPMMLIDTNAVIESIRFYRLIYSVDP